MPTSSLPLCVQYVQALGPSFVAVIAAIIAGYIALRQWWTARDKLRFDLFEKRFNIYEVTKDFINKTTVHGTASIDDITEFYSGIRGAEFLFKGDARLFMMKIAETAFKVHGHRKALEYTPAHPQRDRIIDEEQELLDHLRSYEGDKLEKLFDPT